MRHCWWSGEICADPPFPVRDLICYYCTLLGLSRLQAIGMNGDCGSARKVCLWETDIMIRKSCRTDIGNDMDVARRPVILLCLELKICYGDS